MPSITHVEAVKDLPDVLRRALKAVGYGRPHISVESRDRYTPAMSSGDGLKAFTAVVNLQDETFKVFEGSWGGANIFNPGNAVDLDQTARPIPPNGAVIQGTTGGNHPTWAVIRLHPDNVNKLLQEGPEITLTKEEESALSIISGITSSYRKSEFERAGIGTYSRDNPHVQSLAQKGLIKITGTGMMTTLAGKNYFSTHRRPILADENRVASRYLGILAGK